MRDVLASIGDTCPECPPDCGRLRAARNRSANFKLSFGDLASLSQVRSGGIGSEGVMGSPRLQIFRLICLGSVEVVRRVCRGARRAHSAMRLSLSGIRWRATNTIVLYPQRPT
jgi:hypothetical protein